MEKNNNIGNNLERILHYELPLPGGSVEVSVFKTPEGKGLLNVEYHGFVPEQDKAQIEKIITESVGFSSIYRRRDN